MYMYVYANAIINYYANISYAPHYFCYQIIYINIIRHVMLLFIANVYCYCLLLMFVYANVLLLSFFCYQII